MLLLSLGISNHVFIIPHLIKAAGRDAWISILLGYFALIIWSFVLYWVLKSMRALTFTDWLKQRVGKIGYWVIGAGFILYFLVQGMMIIFDTTKSINIYFLPRTPNTLIVLVFIFVSFLAARSGLKTLIYMSTILLPIVWLLGIGVSWFTMDSKDYGIVNPILSQGIRPGLHGGMIVVGGSIELLVLLMLQHKMKKPLNYGTIFILLTLLVGLIFGPTLGTLSAFGPSEGGNLRFPAFEQWRLVMIGDYISHVDFLAAFQLMSGTILRTALILHIISEVIGIGRQTFRQLFMLFFTILISVPSLIQMSDIQVQTFIYRYFFKYSLLFGVAVAAILFALTFLPQRKGS